MSATPRGRLNFWGAYYDRALLLGVLCGLLASSLFLVLAISRQHRLLDEAQWTRPPAHPQPVVAAPLTELEKGLARLATPFQAPSYTNRMFTSELRVACVKCQKPILFDALSCPFCQSPQPPPEDPRTRDSDADGLPDWWETQYGLNPNNADDAEQDSDGDGFTNAEEYKAGTAPNDPNSYPPLMAKLRVVRIAKDTFKLRFQGEAHLPGGQVTYQLNVRNADKTDFKKIGEQVGGYTVDAFVAKTATSPEMLILKQGDTVIRLARGRDYQQFELIAHILSLLDKSRFRVRIGDTLTLKGWSYKIIDIKRDGVLMREVKTGKQAVVGWLTETERAALTEGPAGAENSPLGPGGVPMRRARPPAGVVR